MTGGGVRLALLYAINAGAQYTATEFPETKSSWIELRVVIECEKLQAARELIY